MNEQAIYALVSGALQRLIDQGIKVKDVSNDTGLSMSTLYKFMRQDTVYPRFHTVVAVLEYLGFEMTVTKKGKRHGVRTEHKQNQPSPSRLL